MEQTSQQEQVAHRRGHQHGGRGRGRPRPTGASDGARPPADQAERAQQRRTQPHRRPPRSEELADGPASSASQQSVSVPSFHPSRRERFKAKLTEATPQAQPSEPQTEKEVEKPKSKSRHARRPPPGDDLTSTLTHALRTPPYPDCPICFNAIRPEHPTWSCSPPMSTTVEARLGPQGSPEAQDVEGIHCCWSTFHLKCIRPWAEKSIKELEVAWRARGEQRPGEWHCPGCRATRQAVPQTYMCFCLRMRNPAPPRIATPHSCAQPCSRPRSTCQHACPLPCHPGPCPPCAVTIQAACFCGKERHSAKCQAGERAASFSCSKLCQKPLQCGHTQHLCAQTCHEGPCPPCPVKEEVHCWCGQDTRLIACGQVKVEDNTECIVLKNDGSEQVWMGSYGCRHPCERPFACSKHTCSKPCHPPSRTPPPCPFDPERVVSCACGQRRIARSFNEFAANSSSRSAPLLEPRASCTSPLPTCTSTCSKFLPCGHLCKATCHWDTCPPCTEQIVRTCRCGATQHKTPCGDGITALHPTGGDTTLASDTILCDKPCQATRSCGRHPCGRICCPLSLLSRIKTPKRRDLSQAEQYQLDPAVRALHECDLPCNRVLACENHRCQERDHKGPCPPCPRGVFEDLVCPCGRMVLEPPIQCGTRLRCVYPCMRLPPACGHAQLPHACHEEVVIAGADTADEGLGLGEEERVNKPCPPCVILTDKLCACGKKQVGNVRCSQEKVSCGTACGKLLTCGFHHCGRPCHADLCGPCTAVCGKPRKSCLPAQHPCTQTCHAPSACPETEPCLTPVTLTCACGHLRSTVPCSGTRLALACTGECSIQKRNARLADALGISEEKRRASAKTVTWSSEIVASARGMGPRFAQTVERAFADFIVSDKRTQVLPHMKLDQRKFVHDLASVYRMDTVMVDQEPHRSVQLIRRIDTRVPMPLLSQHVTAMVGRAGGSPGLGKPVSAAGPTAGGGSAGVSTNAGTGTGTGTGWSTVAKSALGVPGGRSGSTTPVRVPSPGGSRVGASGGGGGGDGVWVSPSVRTLRRQAVDGSAGGVSDVEASAAADPSLIKEVPDNWEDDA